MSHPARVLKSAGILFAAAAFGFVLTAPVAPDADAGGSKARGPASTQSIGGRRGPQVLGYKKRVGGYSYTYQDSILDFRDTSILPDPGRNRTAGPFDSGFFFDSGVERQNNSPYLN